MKKIEDVITNISTDFLLKYTINKETLPKYKIGDFVLLRDGYRITSAIIIAIKPSRDTNINLKKEKMFLKEKKEVSFEGGWLYNVAIPFGADNFSYTMVGEIDILGLLEDFKGEAS